MFYNDVIVIIDGNYLRMSFINYLYSTNIYASLNINKFNNIISNNRIIKGYIIIDKCLEINNEWNKFIENGYIILNDKTYLDLIKENKNKEIILIGNNYYKNMMKLYNIKIYVFYYNSNKQIRKMKNVYFLENYFHLITNSDIYTKIVIYYNILKFNI
jgi:ribosomal protein L30E